MTNCFNNDQLVSLYHWISISENAIKWHNFINCKGNSFATNARLLMKGLYPEYKENTNSNERILKAKWKQFVESGNKIEKLKYIQETMHKFRLHGISNNQLIHTEDSLDHLNEKIKERDFEISQLKTERANLKAQLTASKNKYAEINNSLIKSQEDYKILKSKYDHTLESSSRERNQFEELLSTKDEVIQLLKSRTPAYSCSNQQAPLIQV